MMKWLKNAREGATAQSTIPSVLAAVMAFGASGFNIWMALLGILGVKCAHLAMNLIDDYHDYRADMLQDRLGVVRQGFKAYTAKYPYLTDGSATVKDLKLAIAAFTAVAIVCGGVVFVFRTVQNGFLGANGSVWMLVCVALAAFLGWFYSAPPIKFCYWGAGEAVIGIIFGPLLMIGMSYAAAGTLVPQIGILSIPVGLLVMNILYTHSFIDEKGDKASGKITLAGLIPSAGGKLAVAAVLNFLPFVIVVAAVAAGWVHPAYLAVFLALPRAIWLFNSLIAFTRGEEPPVKKWLGPMGNWEAIKAGGLSWYLSRWFTARNLITLYCIIIALVRIILIFV